MKRFSHPQSGIVAILTFGAALFVCSTIVVVAQDFVNPSDKAPSNNVIDFITQSDESQGRIGRLRIDASATDIPDATAATVDVEGPAYLQGDTTFGKNSGPSLFVNATKVPYYVTSGTNVANGKFNIASTTSYALYAQSSLDNAIFVNSKSAGAPTSPTRNIFGQTTQVATGEKSSGVTGVSTNPAGYGVYAEQLECTGASFSCGLAGQFYGNVVVTGTIIGDGRGVFKTWTMNDGSSTNTAIGISLRTLTVEDEDFAGGDSATIPGAVLPGEDFISLSVLLDDALYNPQRGGLAPSDSQFLSFQVNPDTGALSVQKNQTAVMGTAIVTVYYHQQLSVTISVDEDLNGDTETPDLANPYYALVGSGKVTTFLGELGGGGFDGSQFTWTLYKDTNADNEPDTLCSGNECGQVLIATDETTAYIAPDDFPSTGEQVWLRATWTSDTGVYASQQIDLYKVTITNTPASDFLYINGSTHDFNATVECPTPSCPTLSWSLGSAFGNGEAIDASGVYTPPTQVVSGESWTGQVRATIQGITPTLTQTYDFDLLPHVRIIATMEGDNETGQGPWVASTTASDYAHVGITCSILEPCDRGHTLRIEAIAEGIPEVLQHNFNWRVDPLNVGLVGESVLSGSGLSVTNNDNQVVQYTAPSNPKFSVTSEKIRTVMATWRNSQGTASASSRGIQVVLGRGTIPRAIISRSANATGTYLDDYQLFGFSTPDARRIYEVCNNEECSDTTQVINWAANPNPTESNPITLTPTTCGSLQIIGLGSTDPRSMNLKYTGGSASCTQVLYLRAYGDTRASSQIFLRTTSGNPTCTGCNLPKPPLCCFEVVDPGDPPDIEF